MFGTAAPTGLTPLQLIEILSAAVAISIASGGIYRRRLAKTRTDWRNQDGADGYRDARGWHPGAVDKVNGWTDDTGWHDGLDKRVDRLEANDSTTRQIVERHRSDSTAHSRGT